MSAHQNCADRFRVDPYVDGALDAVQTLETEAHLEGCPCCRESAHFLAALKGATKKSVELEVPEGFAERMMAAAKARAEVAVAVPTITVREVTPSASLGRVHLAVGAVALAAGAVLFVNVRQAEAERVAAAHTLGEFMAEHRSPLPVDTQKVHELERYVGIPVRAPALKNYARLRLMGARVLPVMESRAAMLQYQVDGSGEPGRVSVFIYDPAKIRVDDATFEDRRVGESQVRVGRASGYSVAVTQRAGVGYAVASDLNTVETAQMVGQFE